MIDAADEAAGAAPTGQPDGGDGARPGGLGDVAHGAPEARGAGADQASAAVDLPRRTGCTTAQMRRFIKSRPYIPLHELRRRFQIEGDDDEVHGFETDGRRVFVGLPERESEMLGELVRQGEVGYELLLDPTSPLVVGVFPMRPVPHN